METSGITLIHLGRHQNLAQSDYQYQVVGTRRKTASSEFLSTTVEG